MSWNALRRFVSGGGGAGDHSATGGADDDRKATSPGTIMRLWKGAMAGLSRGGDDSNPVVKTLSFQDEKEPTTHEAEEKKRLADKATETFNRLELRSKEIRARAGGWDNMRKAIGDKRRKYLEAELRLTHDNPSLAHVVQLAHTSLDKPHHTADAAYSGAMLFEWAAFRGFELNESEQLLLARAHAEVWLARGLAAERYHLDRAKALFDNCLKPHREYESAAPWLEYARVLQNMGNRPEAINILQHIVSSFESDPEMPNYLFYIGAMLKAEGLYDEASNYFFEASSSGPPRFFNKLDMMFIISRNIDEEGAVNGEPNEEAYEMVYSHLQIEGMVKPEVSYEDWLCDSATWRGLGDKCALHGMFALATDLYAQGLMKDSNSFRKPKLWFAFAKACHRCNRGSDASLAVKQALTMDPYNRQLVRANEICSGETRNFERMLEGDLLDVLDRLHAHHESANLGANRLQAMYRGKKDKRGLAAATGQRSDITKRMRCTVSVLLGDEHPVILTARANWMGTVSHIIATNVSGETANLKLVHPFTPLQEHTTHPRKLELRMIVKPDEHKDRHLITLRFEDSETGQYIERVMSLSFREHDTQGKLVHKQVLKAGQKEDKFDDIDAKLLAEGRHKTWTLFDSLRFKDTHETLTDITEIDIEKGCINNDYSLYLYTLRNEGNDTVVSFLQVSSDLRVEFRMAREHLDRSRNLKKSVQMLLELGLMFPPIRAVFLPTQDKGDLTVTMVTHPKSGKSYRMTVQHPDTKSLQGMVVKINETYSAPILADHFEKTVSHKARELTAEEKAKLEWDESLHSVDATSAKLRLRRTGTIRQERKTMLAKRVLDNPGEFDYAQVEKIHAKIVKIVEPNSEENSVLSGFRDVYVPELDTDGKLLEKFTLLHATPVKDEAEGAQSGKNASDAHSPSRPRSGEGARTNSLRKKKSRGEHADDAPDPDAEKTPDADKTPGGTSKKNKKSQSRDTTTANTDHENDDDMSQVSQLSNEEGFENSMTPGAENEDGNAVDGDEEDLDESEEEEESPGKSGKPKKTKKSKKVRDKEARDKARKSAMKARLEAVGGSSHLQFMGGDEDEDAKKKERDEKKKQQREKMAAEKAKLLALAAERKAAKAAGKEVAVSDVKEESPKKKKKAQKKATLDASVFLKHQETRLEASEYLLQRARAVKVRIGKEENGKWLLQRAFKARATCDEIEDKERMDAALAEAENKRRGALKSTGSTGVSGKFKRKKTLRAGQKRIRGSFDGDDSDTVDGPESVADTDALDDGDEKTIADARMQDPLKPTQEGDAGSTVEAGGDAADRSLAGKTGVGEQAEQDVLYVKPKKAAKPSKYPVFKKPIVQRERVGAIEMHRKPTLSHRQLERLRRPLEPSDLPASAYASAEGLLSALRAHYSAPLSNENTQHSYPEQPSIAYADGMNSLQQSVADLSLMQAVVSGAGDGQDSPLVGLTDGSIVAPAPNADVNQDDILAPASASVEPGQGPATPAIALPSVAFDPALPAGSVGPPAAVTSPGKAALVSLNPLPVNFFDVHALLGQRALTDVSVITDMHAERFIHLKRAALQRAKERSGDSKSSQGQSREFAINPFEPVRVPNNLGFLDAGGAHVNSASFAKEGLALFKTRGYVDGASKYASHWREKLTLCLELYQSGAILRKSICSLLKLSAHPLTKLEAFCALADSQGSQVEALGRLADPEFMREVKTVCALLPVAEILSRLHGALDVDPFLSNAMGKGETLSKSADRPHAHAFRPVGDNSMLRSLQGVTSQTPTAFESRHNLVKPAPEGLHTGTGGQMRVHSHVAAKVLPHLDMKVTSPITRARSTKIIIVNKLESNKSQSSLAAGFGGATEPLSAGFSVLPLTSPPPPSLNAPFEQGGVAEPPVEPSEALKSLLSSVHAPLRSSSPLSFNGSRVNSPKTTGNKSYGRYAPKVGPPVTKSGATSLMSSLGNHSAKIPVQEFQKSRRLDSVIDEIFEQADSHLLVMCRRDAIRAAGEEILSRSTATEFQDKAKKRSKEMLALQRAREAQKSLPSQASDAQVLSKGSHY